MAASSSASLEVSRHQSVVSDDGHDEDDTLERKLKEMLREEALAGGGPPSTAVHGGVSPDLTFIGGGLADRGAHGEYKTRPGAMQAAPGVVTQQSNAAYRPPGECVSVRLHVEKASC